MFTGGEGILTHGHMVIRFDPEGGGGRGLGLVGSPQRKPPISRGLDAGSTPSLLHTDCLKQRAAVLRLPFLRAGLEGNQKEDPPIWGGHAKILQVLPEL